MRTSPRACLILTLLAAWGCADAPAEPDASDPFDLGELRPALNVVPAVPAVCGPVTATRLIADETVPAGVIEVVNDEANLYVIYRTSAGWPIRKTALFVGESVTGIPTSGGGNPQVGRFPHKSSHGHGTTEVIWEIPLDAAPGSELVIAAFAETGGEGAWGEGPMMSPGGSWAMYLTHIVANCAAENVGPAGGMLMTPDGNAMMSIPDGALSAPVDITIVPATAEEILDHIAGQGGGGAAAPSGVSGTAAVSASATAAAARLPTIRGLIPLEGTLWDFGPDGLQFDKPVTVTLHYDDSKIPFGFDESDLGVFVINGVIPYIPAPSLVDPVANTVTATIDHFSYGFVAVEEVVLADLAVSGLVESADPIELGQSITYAATLSNFGPSDIADGVVFYQAFGDVVAGPLEPGCTLEPVPFFATVQIDCEVGAVPSGGSAVAPSATFVPQRTGSLFEIWVDPGSSESTDPVIQNNRATADFVVTGATADLSIQTFDDAPDPAAVGEEVTYAVNVSVDDAAQTVEGATLLFSFADATFVSASDEACFATLLGATCPLPPLPDGIIHGVAVTLLPDAEVDELRVIARLELPPGTTDTDPTNDFAVQFTTIGSAGSADLSILNAVESADPIAPGQPVTYTATMYNFGPDPAADAVVYYSMFGDAVVAGSLNPACTEIVPPVIAKVEIVCTVGDLDAEGVTLAPWATFVPQTPGEYTVWINPGSAAADPNIANNRFETTVTVTSPQADLRVDRIDDTPDPTPAGGVVVYEIDAVAMETTQFISDAVLQILFTGDVNVASTTIACTPIAGGIGCPLNLPAGLVRTVSVTTTLPTEGEVTVDATIIAPAGITDSDPSNDTMSETTTVGPPLSGSISVGELIEATLPLGGDTAKYSLQLDAPQTIRIHLSHLSSHGSAQLVLRAAGADTTIYPGRLPRGQASDGLSASHVLDLPAGTYTLGVVSKGSGPYRVGVGTGQGRADTGYGTQQTGFTFGPFDNGNPFRQMALVGNAVVIAGDDALAKFDAGGVADAGFGSAGLVDLDAIGGLGRAVAVQPDGRIVVAARTTVSPYPWIIARFEANGSLDASFGTGGIVQVTSFGTRSSSQPLGIGFQQNGADLDIVVGGEAGDLQNRVAIARLNPDGSLDAGFGTGGVVWENGGFTPHGMTVQPDGRILITDTNQVLRYTAAGARDASFGSNGLVTYGGGFAARGVEVLPDGDLLFVGNVGDDAAALRLTPGGAPDAFGSGGIAAFHFGLEERFLAAAQDASGNLILVGHQRTFSDGWEFLISRVSATGVLDLDFGVVGYALENRGDEARAVAFDTQGRFIVGGQQMGAGNRIQVSRHLPN